MNSPQTARSAPAAFLVILGINILVFVLQIIKGVDPMSPDTRDLIGWGANVAPLTLTGEPWRLLTSMFLHIGLVHLAVNSYMLVVLGRVVEWEFGSVRFTLIYLLSGLFGSLASALWYASFKVSAGASGALMGIAGACLAHSLIAYLRNEKGEAGRLRGPLIQTIGLNLVLGAIIPGVDNAAHIGGLIAGAVIGGIFALSSFNSALKRSLVAVVVSLASLTLLHSAVTGPPSAALVQIKLQLLRELARTPTR